MTATRAFALSDIGLTRSNNQDSGYAGTRLFLVADGMGGHAGGDVASAVVVQGVPALDQDYPTTKDAIGALRRGLLAAADRIGDLVAEHPQLGGMGTTVSGIALVGDEVVLAHIGDSRVYRLRQGRLEQMTVDHTFVQRLVDTGRITQEEAAHHPRRSVLMRVLGDIGVAPEIDAEVFDTTVGDRWLLCSDGLSSYVSESDVRKAMQAIPDPESAARRLLELALDAGAPDNVTIVIVDPGDAVREGEPLIVGSAANPVEFEAPRTRSVTRLPQILRHPLRSSTIEDTHFEPETDEFLAALIAEDRKRLARRRVAAMIIVVLSVAAIVVAGWLGYRWTQTRYFVGADPTGTYVAVYQGVQQDLGPITLHHLVRVYDDLPLADLPAYRRDAVVETISRDSLADADTTIQELRNAAD